MPAILIVILLALGALILGVNAVKNTPAVPAPPAPSAAIQAVAQAIAIAEGSNPAWNNPGDLTKAFGYPTKGVANSDGVLIFADPTSGWLALYAQLSAIVNGGSRYTLSDTIASFGIGYSGGDPNWAVNVANALGVTPDTPLGQVLS